MEWTTKFPRSKPWTRLLLYLSLAGFVCCFSLRNPSMAYAGQDEESSVCVAIKAIKAFIKIPFCRFGHRFHNHSCSNHRKADFGWELGCELRRKHDVTARTCPTLEREYGPFLQVYTFYMYEIPETWLWIEHHQKWKSMHAIASSSSLYVSSCISLPNSLRTFLRAPTSWCSGRP